MYLADDVGAGDDQIINTVLKSFAAKVVLRELVVLDAGAHSAIEDDDVVVDGVQVAPVAEVWHRRFHAAHDSTGRAPSIVLLSPWRWR